jgi:hypothetical protein
MDSLLSANNGRNLNEYSIPEQKCQDFYMYFGFTAKCGGTFVAIRFDSACVSKAQKPLRV